MVIPVQSIPFFSPVDYYGLLVRAGLAGYVLERDGSRSLSILSTKWKSSLDNKEYSLSRENAVYAVKRFDLGALIAGRKQGNKSRHRYHAVPLGGHDSESYISNIGLQRDK